MTSGGSSSTARCCAANSSSLPWGAGGPRHRLKAGGGTRRTIGITGVHRTRTAALFLSAALIAGGLASCSSGTTPNTSASASSSLLWDSSKIHDV